MKCLFILTALILTACAGNGSGILVQFDGSKPLEQAQVDRNCDMEDSAACLLLGKPMLKPPPRLPLVQGIAPAGKAIFAALLENGQKARWFLREGSSLELRPLTPYRSYSRPGFPARIDHVQADKLEPGKSYELIGVNELGQLLDHRTFRTLSENRELRFALLSSTDDHSIPHGLWADLLEQSPDILFSLGNNVYAHSRGAAEIGPLVDPDTLWARHSEARQAMPVFRDPKLIPFFVTWNSHDFGMLGGNLTYSHKDEARKITEAFFPYLPDAKTVLEGPGLSHALKLAGHTFLLLDNRSFRAPPSAEEKAYFGRMQEDWAISLVGGSSGPVWLMSGERWFGGRESFERNDPGSFVSFLSSLAQAKKKAAKSKGPGFLFFAGGQAGQTEIVKIPSQATQEFLAGFQLPSGYLLVDSRLGETELKLSAAIRGREVIQKTFTETFGRKKTTKRKR